MIIREYKRIFGTAHFRTKTRWLLLFFNMILMNNMSKKTIVEIKFKKSSDLYIYSVHFLLTIINKKN